MTAGGFGGLKIYDIIDPAAPVLVGAAETTYAQHIAVSSGIAYVADGGGIRIADVSDAPLSTVIGTASLPNIYML